MTTATFAIGGMHCASCAARNERALQKIPGVREANVNLGTRSARVEFDDAAVSEAALHEAILRTAEFRLSGREMRGVRQAVTRARRAGHPAGRPALGSQSSSTGTRPWSAWNRGSNVASSQPGSP